MKVCLLYVYPNLEQSKYVPLAQRFARSYTQNPPGQADHTVHVIVNGLTSPKEYLDRMFAPLPVSYLSHNNWGKDIGGFIAAAQVLPCDLLVCLGSYINFHLPGWLDRIVSAYADNGPALYGAWAFHQPAPHIRTTAFWCPPEILNGYPWEVGNGNRYSFEHGTNSITLWAKSVGFETFMVTRSGCYADKDWHHVEKDDCLFLDQHAARIGY